MRLCQIAQLQKSIAHEFPSFVYASVLCSVFTANIGIIVNHFLTWKRFISLVKFLASKTDKMCSWQLTGQETWLNKSHSRSCLGDCVFTLKTSLINCLESCSFKWSGDNNFTWRSYRNRYKQSFLIMHQKCSCKLLWKIALLNNQVTTLLRYVHTGMMQTIYLMHPKFFGKLLRK